MLFSIPANQPIVLPDRYEIEKKEKREKRQEELAMVLGSVLFSAAIASALTLDTSWGKLSLSSKTICFCLIGAFIALLALMFTRFFKVYKEFFRICDEADAKEKWRKRYRAFEEFEYRCEKLQAKR